MRLPRSLLILVLTLGFLRPDIVLAEGTTGASFLDIPVGAGPAAMGSAYSALATDAYAPTWNPAGLGVLDQFQMAAQHLSYLQSTDYEYVSVGVPLHSNSDCVGLLCGQSAVGGSIQYFGSGDIQGLDTYGNPTGTYSIHYAAYNMSYGKMFGDKLSLGVTGKWINAALDDVSANAFGLDLGSFYKVRDDVQVAATLMNAGTDLNFLNDGDPLPLQLHLAGAYEPRQDWTLSLETIVPRGGSPSVEMGTQWRPIPEVALRTGFRSDTLSGLSALAGFSGGIGINLWNLELAYAWVPYGNLGDSQYLSLVVRFGDIGKNKRNLIEYKPAKNPPSGNRGDKDQESEPRSLMELLNDDPLPTNKSQ